MSRPVFLAVVGVVALTIGTIWLPLSVSGQVQSVPSPADGEWPHYAADQWSSRYSPLNQINASNFRYRSLKRA